MLNGHSPQHIGQAGADALKMVHERHPGVAETMVGALEANEESSSIQAVLRCARILEDAGFERPSWAVICGGSAHS